jgi:ERCC4-type nuclease
MLSRVTIVADNRERNGAIPYLEVCIAENNRYNSKFPVNIGGGEIHYLEKQLTIGDYCILLPGEVLALIVERKTWKDLAASIKDGRMKGQQERLAELRDTKGCLVYFIIEGSYSYSDDHKICNIPFRNLHAKLRHNALRGFPFFQTKTPEATAKLLVDLARDVLKLSAQGEMSFTSSEGGNENTDTSASDEPSSDIPIELKTRKVHSNQDILANMWESIPGVSSKSSPILMQKYRISEIICAGEKRLPNLRAEISELRYAGGRVFGEAMAKKILAIAEDDPGSTGVKILKCIPNITDATAQCILERYSLRELCSGEIPPDDIAKIKKGDSNRKVGIAAAERILEVLRS